MLILGGVYVAFSTVVGLLFSHGSIADYGPPVMALVLLAVFLVAARDPAQRPPARQP